MFYLMISYLIMRNCITNLDSPPSSDVFEHVYQTIELILHVSHVFWITP